MTNDAADDFQRPLPHGNCYAVVPGGFLAGEYPVRFPSGWVSAGGAFRRSAVSSAARRAYRRLEEILHYGVTDFIDLTREEDGLEPYEEAAKKSAEKLKVEVRYRRFQIYDGSIPESNGQTCAILDLIDKRMEDGGCVYLHCWGGIGRTGTIVGCFLVRHGLDPEEALRQIESHWSSMVKYDPYWTSPENELQKDYVRSWSEKERQR